MIYISLENGRINILERRKIYASLPLIMPLVFEINKALSSLNKERNINCNVYVRIANAINLEVKNIILP
jgi:hypothetical protein